MTVGVAVPAIAGVASTASAEAPPTDAAVTPASVAARPLAAVKVIEPSERTRSARMSAGETASAAVEPMTMKLPSAFSLMRCADSLLAAAP